jgi:hypothetical protein
MRKPFPTTPPSEATVEQIANHQILCLIASFGAWFYVPTRPEEQRLGYDASLQGHKALIIQYKRFRPAKRGASVGLSVSQHTTLTTNFPKKSTPYVFYAFALHPGYDEIRRQFDGGFGFLFGLSTLYIDAHSIPVGATSISVRYRDLRLTAGRPKVDLSARCLPTLVREFQSCTSGLRAESFEDGRETVIDRRVTIPHLNILWARIA